MIYRITGVERIRITFRVSANNNGMDAILTHRRAPGFADLVL